MKKTQFAIVVFTMLAMPLEAGTSENKASSTSGVLYDTLAQMDQHVFETAFVECDAETFRELFTDDAEFYHDVTGPTYHGDVWTLKGCPGNDGVERLPVPESFEVFPMNGYGAIQSGEHWFVEEGAANSTVAKFIHLWHFEDDKWRISRVLSFDHRSLPNRVRTDSLEAPREAAVNAELLETVKALDAVVFEDGYNDCNIEKLATVIDEDLEFYHDQGGPQFGGQVFLDAMRNGICELDYKARRELVDGSMEIFPLYNHGKLYGVIQTGDHRFHAEYPGEAEYPSGIAKFTMLWILKDGEWKLSRALSYDHHGIPRSESAAEAG